MKTYRSAAILLLATLSLGLGLPRSSGGAFGLFRNFWGDVLVSTDTTPEGRALTPPAPGKPVYYLGQVLPERLGTIRGDESPDTKQMMQYVTKVLAKQGYVGAQSGGHEPALYLIVQWGYLSPRDNDLMWFLGYHADQDIAAPNPIPGQLGAEIWRRNFRSPEIETILQDMGGPVYGIIVTAFEYKSASTPNPVIYWQSRIGLPANGKSMAQALPTMLIAAGPAIGVPSDKPMLRDTDDVRHGRVDLGELKFLDDDGKPAPANRADGEKK